MTDQKSVLVIDDDNALCGALESKFLGKGYTVVVCKNGEDAITAMNEQKFHVIMTDLHMPGKDGFAVLEEKAKTRNIETPAYVITNLGTDQYCDKAIGLGAKKCFVKSLITLKEVVEVVDSELCA
ncbi:response regulator [Candidatus Peregrinibacteria bacterium]|jgi:DNA-binding NtrC family response regulator|nr:response regulator [Candidatus Peregrinibacteria bacterium]MBT7338057.1 response regulator [Candidatus Peregrinibacteria bacterium]